MLGAGVIGMAILGALGVTAGDAHAGPWRSTSAPSQEWQLLAYAAALADSGDEQPPNQPEPKGSQEPPPTNQPPQQNPNPFPPSFQQADTSIHADTLRAFPGMNAAPIETLGAHPAPPILTNTPTPPPAVKRHGAIFGMPPLVLLAGLIALHIFVVSSVVK